MNPSEIIGRTVRLKIPMKATGEMTFQSGAEFRVVGVALHHLIIVLNQIKICPACLCAKGEIRGVRLVDVEVLPAPERVTEEIESEMPEP